MSSAALTAFGLGGLTIGAVIWTLATASERWRRLRHDITTAKTELKTLRKMLLSTLASLLGAGLIVAGVAAGIVAMMTVTR